RRAEPLGVGRQAEVAVPTGHEHRAVCEANPSGDVALLGHAPRRAPGLATGVHAALPRRPGRPRVRRLGRYPAARDQRDTWSESEDKSAFQEPGPMQHKGDPRELPGSDVAKAGEGTLAGPQKNNSIP